MMTLNNKSRLLAFPFVLKVLAALVFYLLSIEIFQYYSTYKKKNNVPKLRFYFNTEQTRMNCQRAVRSRRRVIRLLVAVVISFMVCVLPHHIRILLWSKNNA
jgi:hypothetical protein